MPALAAGVHVLTEKPLDVFSAKARAIIAAAAKGKVRLVVAYRLHFEPATLDAIRRIRKGELGDLDDTVAVTLRMPGNRPAQFTVSYCANAVDSLIIAGTKGVDPDEPRLWLRPGPRASSPDRRQQEPRDVPVIDQFGGELKYFSDCILEKRDPEPDGEEGLADLLVIEAIVAALKTGGRVEVAPLARLRRIAPDDQEQILRAVSSPEPVNASNPTVDG